MSAIATAVCPPGHAHDRSTVCYKIHRCRCLFCRSLNARREQRRQQLIAYGRHDTGLVDAQPVREHLNWLSHWGIGRRRVAELTGVPQSTLSQLMSGRTGARDGEQAKRIARTSADAVLALRPTLGAYAGGGLVPARGAHRRLQALVAGGYTLTSIAVRLDMSTTNLLALLERDRMTSAKFREIARLYEQTAHIAPAAGSRQQRGAATRARRYAAARGWVLALAWDDIDRDPEPARRGQQFGGVA